MMNFHQTVSRGDGVSSRSHEIRGWVPQGRSVAQAWRVARAALSYAAFGMAALGLAATVVPAIHLFTRDRGRAERRVQALLHRAFRTYLTALEWLGIARFRCSRPSLLAEPGILVVANHPTRLDAVVLLAFMPQADCIVKQEYLDNVFLRHVARAAGYIPHTGGRAVVETCTERLVRGRSLVVFPEGTRSPDGGLAPVQRGAAHIALQAGCDLLPVTIRCEPPTLKKGQPWWDVPETAFEISLEVGSPIRTKEVVDDEPTRGRAARVLTRAIREHFEQRLGHVRES